MTKKKKPKKSRLKVFWDIETTPIAEKIKIELFGV